MKRNSTVIFILSGLLSACVVNTDSYTTFTPVKDVSAAQTSSAETVIVEGAANTPTRITAQKLTQTPIPASPAFNLTDFNAAHIVDDLAFNIDGKTIAVATNGFHMYESGEKGVWLWDADHLERPISSFETLLHGPNSVAFSHDGQLLAISGCEPTDDPAKCIQIMLVMNWKTQETLYKLTAEGRPISRIYFSFDDHILCAQDVSGNISLWNLETGKREYSFTSVRGIQENNFAFSPDGLAAAMGVADGVEIRDLKTTNLLKKYGDLWGGVFFAPVVAFSLDGQRVAMGGCTKSDFEFCVSQTMTVFDTEDGKKMAELICDSLFTSVEFSPDGQWLAIGTLDGLQMWSFQTQKPISISDLSDVSIFDLAFSLDGNTLVVGSATGLHILKLSEINFE